MVWKCDLNQYIFAILFLRLLLSFSFDWEDISNTRDSVSSHFQTPQISSKILRCASYFQLSSQCLEIWWNTVSRVWYITSKTSFRAKKRSHFQNDAVSLFKWQTGPNHFQNALRLITKRLQMYSVCVNSARRMSSLPITFPPFYSIGKKYLWSNQSDPIFMTIY